MGLKLVSLFTLKGSQTLYVILAFGLKNLHPKPQARASREWRAVYEAEHASFLEKNIMKPPLVSLHARFYNRPIRGLAVDGHIVAPKIIKN